MIVVASALAFTLGWAGGWTALTVHGRGGDQAGLSVALFAVLAAPIVLVSPDPLVSLGCGVTGALFGAVSWLALARTDGGDRS